MCTLSAHCAGLDTNNIIFWTYWSTLGSYTKRYPPRGNLVFHVVRYFLFDTPNFFFCFRDCGFFCVFETGTGPGDPRRIRSALFDHPVDPRGVYKGVNGKGMEMGKGKRLGGLAPHSCVALRSLVISKKSVFWRTERIGCTSMIIIHPQRTKQGRCEQESLPSSFASSFSFLSVSFLDVRWASLPSLYHSTWKIVHLCLGHGTGLHTSDRSLLIPLEKGE